MFYSMRALPLYNPLLTHAVDILIATGIELRVYHVPGTSNTVADHLSCWKNEDASTLVRGLAISTFQPPQIKLGVASHSANATISPST